MKRAFLTFVVAVMLTASLAACTSTPTDTNRATGNGNGSVMGGNSAGSGARSGGSNTGSGMGASGRSSGSGGSTMSNSGRYYADDNGDVFGGNDGIGNDIGHAAGDVMNGMGNAVQDMTR